MTLELPVSVKAATHNKASFEEGQANAALDPGTGCYIYNDTVYQAGANAQTKRVVREKRNPPSEIGGGEVLDNGYGAGNNAETLGFMSHDRARLRLSSNASADPVGNEAAWDENGEITDASGTVDGTNAPDTFVGRVHEVISRDNGQNFALVEFY